MVLLAKEQTPPCRHLLILLLNEQEANPPLSSPNPNPLVSISHHSKGVETRKPSGIKRATQWTPSVEEQYRLQSCGWRDIVEYESVYGEPERWLSNEFIKCLRVKKNGFFTYWREWKECEDKYLNRVKMYIYAD